VLLFRRAAGPCPTTPTASRSIWSSWTIRSRSVLFTRSPLWPSVHFFVSPTRTSSDLATSWSPFCSRCNRPVGTSPPFHRHGKPGPGEGGPGGRRQALGHSGAGAGLDRLVPAPDRRAVLWPGKHTAEPRKRRAVVRCSPSARLQATSRRLATSSPRRTSPLRNTGTPTSNDGPPRRSTPWTEPDLRHARAPTSSGPPTDGPPPYDPRIDSEDDRTPVALVNVPRPARWQRPHGDEDRPPAPAATAQLDEATRERFRPRRRLGRLEPRRNVAAWRSQRSGGWWASILALSGMRTTRSLAAGRGLLPGRSLCTGS
jgi:hypothetical protein